MTYKLNNVTIIDNARVGDGFNNVTIQNNGFLEVNSSHEYQGTVAAFMAGGYNPPAPTPPVNLSRIERFSFASSVNGTNIGNLTAGRRSAGPNGQCSSTNGYVTGGTIGTTIEKFLFATTTNASNIGNLSTSRAPVVGVSSQTTGYAATGTTVDKFPFATDTNATLSSINLTTSSGTGAGGITSSTHGYVSGGGSGSTNRVEKFPFASDTNATDVGDLTVPRRSVVGQSSVSHGYTTGGYAPFSGPLGGINTIDKFPFSVDTNASDVGDITTSTRELSGHTSTEHGYRSGGTLVSVIDRFPFSVDTNASSVGNLSTPNRLHTGHQD
jgi:hypothetical protein